MPGIPSGTVTFLFTDIEGSTSHWEREPERMQRDFARQEALLRSVFAAYGGYVYKMIGDAFQVAFATAPVALRAAVDAQRRLLSAPWEGEPIRVRMALHTGVTEERGDDYVGPALNRVARLLAAGHGGQVLLSQAAHELVRDDLPEGVDLVDTGEHRLKDLIRPERIYQAITSGLPDQFPPLKTLDAYPHNLPTQLNSFVGREKEIEEIRRLMTGPGEEARLVTLTGAGGTGKSRLSLHVAADLLETFAGGAWFVELAALSDPALVPQTIACVLGICQGAGGSSLAGLIDFMGSKRLLLVLDNCEHLVEACARTAEALLRSCPQVFILASSREVLGVAGERVYRVPALTTPDAHHLPTLETLSQFEAVRLFIERAVSVSPGFTVNNANAPALAEICHRLDGMPLAIELVAARVAMLSLEQIAARLGNVFHLLTGGSRTALPRHQTFRALIDWSYDLLPPAEQRLFRRLSVFNGGWNLEAAEAVCSDPPPADGADAEACIDPLDVLDLLGQLVNKSLVQIERDNGSAMRYRLLETIRQYAAEKLRAEGAEARARDRHQAYFLGLADQPEEALRGPDQAAWIERFEADLDNLRAALDWSAGSGDLEAGLRAAAALLWFWHIRNRGGEGVDRMLNLLALDQARSAASGEPLSLPRSIARARALNAVGFFNYSYNEDCAGAVENSEEVLALFGRQPGPDADPRVRHEVAFAYLNLGREGMVGREFGGARAHFQRALALYEGIGSRFGMAESLNELGALAMIEGRREEATTYLEQALALRRSIGDQDGIGYNLGVLGEFAFLTGDLRQAVALLDESLVFFQRSRNSVFSGLTIDYLSKVIWLSGDPQGAIRRYEEYARARSGGAIDPETAADLMMRRADIALADGDYEQAARLYEQAMAFGQQVNNEAYTGNALMGLGRAAWAQGNDQLAEKLLKSALLAARRFAMKGMIGQAYCALARLFLSRGEEAEAEELIRQGLPLFVVPYFYWGMAIGLELSIILTARQGRMELAARLFGAAEQLLERVRAYHTPVECAQLDEAVAATRAALGAQAFEQAAGGGRALTLEQVKDLALGI